MNLKVVIRVRGFAVSSKAALIRMIEDDVAYLPKRLKMTSATVEEVKVAKS